MQLPSHFSHLAKLASAFSPEDYTDVSHISQVADVGLTTVNLRLHSRLYCIDSHLVSGSGIDRYEPPSSATIKNLLDSELISLATALQMASLPGSPSWPAFSNKSSYRSKRFSVNILLKAAMLLY